MAAQAAARSGGSINYEHALWHANRMLAWAFPIAAARGLLHRPLYCVEHGRHRCYRLPRVPR